MSLYLPLLFGSWVASILGVATLTEWSFLKRIVISFIVTALMVGTHIYIRKTHSQEQSISSGALVEITAEPPEQLPDGSFYFPIAIKNIDQLPLVNYNDTLVNLFVPKILSKEEENEQLYKNAVYTFYDDVNTLERNYIGIDNALRAGTIRILTNPNIRLTQEQMNDINAGRMFAYVFMAVEYAGSEMTFSPQGSRGHPA